MPKAARLPSLSLSWRILLFGCGAVIFTALIIGTLQYTKTKQITTDAAMERLASETRLASFRINATFTEVLNDTLVVSNAYSIQGFRRSQSNGGIDPIDGSSSANLQKRVANAFTSLMIARPHYSEISYVGVADQGRELVRVSRGKDGIQVASGGDLKQQASEPYYQAALQLEPGKLQFSKLTLDKEAGQTASSQLPILHLTTPVYDDNQQYFGMVVVSVDYRLLIKAVLTQINHKYSVYVTNGLTNYIERNRDGQFSEWGLSPGPVLPPPAFLGAIRASSQQEQSFTEGEEVGYYVPIMINPGQADYWLGIMSHMPASELFEQANRTLGETLLAMVLLMAAACIVAGLVAKRIARPISQVTQAIASFGYGQAAAPDLPLWAQGEIGDLAKAFHYLTERLHQAYESEDKLSIQLDAIIENSVDGIIITDEQGIIGRVNPACAAVFGYEADELVGENVAKLMPELTSDHLEQFVRAEDQTMPLNVIGRIRDEFGQRKDGSIFPIALSISEIRLADRRIFTGMIRDISTRKETEAKLRASEEMFRSAIHDAPIGMALVDPSGRFLEVNKALGKLLGFSSDELKQIDLQAVVYPDELKGSLDRMQQIMAGELDNYQMETRQIGKSGAVVWTTLSVSAVRHADGSLRYFIVQIEDITARKEMDRLKNEFVSVVSHELRTPLTSIHGSLGLATSIMKDLPESVTKLLDIAQKNSDRMILLVNDILDMEKIAAGQMEFHIQDEDFGAVVRQAIEANEAYAHQYHVGLVFTTPDAPLPIRADPARLVQVMSNLISNAAKFSPPGSQIEIELKQRGGRIRLSVCDHGPGIPEAFRSHIFQPFAQAASASSKKGGSGLGLHISKLIIEKMGGAIGFSSVEGEGSTFWIDLPLRQSESSEMPPESSAIPPRVACG